MLKKLLFQISVSIEISASCNIELKNGQIPSQYRSLKKRSCKRLQEWLGAYQKLGDVRF